MSRKTHVGIADCSYSILVRIAAQCGFNVSEGRKHCKIKTKEGRFVTIIPRHSRLKRETSKGIIGALNSFGARITYS